MWPGVGDFLQIFTIAHEIGGQISKLYKVHLSYTLCGVFLIL